MFIDLSIPLNEDTPVYPGDPKTQIKRAGILEKDGYSDHYVCIGTHVGTHIDAPSHMISGGENIDKIPLGKFTGRGVYIKVSNKKFDIEEIKKTLIKKGDVVFFHTSMSDEYQTPEYFTSYPAIPESVVNYLVEKNIKVVGVDMCSVDHEPFPVHKILLREEILLIENLTNLDKLKGQQFKIYALPIRLQIDGAPARVIAEVF